MNWFEKWILPRIFRKLIPQSQLFQVFIIMNEEHRRRFYDDNHADHWAYIKQQLVWAMPWMASLIK